jgi:uncharacterized membrane protein (DUF4010 family)
MIAQDGLAAQADMGLLLLAALAGGLLVGIERGWRQREEADGARVAGVRTFTLLGGCGGLISVLGIHFSPLVAAIVLAALVVLLVGAFLRPRINATRRDATTMIAAIVTLSLGLLAGAGYAALALAGAALTTTVLALRQPIHGILKALSEEEIRAIARYAVIAVAVLPFLPDADYGPYNAWNPFRLWLVVLLVTGFSIVGYIANRVIGQDKGTIATAVIGGAYSSTAVTAAFAGRLKERDESPLATGIALTSAVMYIRVVLLATLIGPVVALPMLWMVGPAAVTAFAMAGLCWRIEHSVGGTGAALTSKPFELLPALGFLLAVAGASLLVNWAQAEYGAGGSAISLFIAGSFDVDAALISYSTLPQEAVPVSIAALALAGTVAINMAFKTAIVFASGGWKAGKLPGLSLAASLGVLAITIAFRGAVLLG